MQSPLVHYILVNDLDDGRIVPWTNVMYGPHLLPNEFPTTDARGLDRPLFDRTLDFALSPKTYVSRKI